MSNFDRVPPVAGRGHVPLLAIALLVQGCVLAPHGTDAERARVAAAGQPYGAPAAERLVPDLPQSPDWRDLLRHSFLSNGDLEAAYFAWRAAVERIDIAAGYPNTNLSLGFEYLFSGGNLKGWDATSLALGFDPMQNLSFPTKVVAAGRVAYQDARAAGWRFAAAKFALQRQVLDAYLDYALQAERIRLQREQTTLLRLAADTAVARVQGGMPQQDLLDAEVEQRHAEHTLRDLESELPQQRARLNALIGRAPDAPLPPPAQLPPPRGLDADEARLLEVAAVNNPELQAVLREAGSRNEALELARQQYFPDVNPFVGLTGSVEQVVGAAVTFSTMIPQIQAGIREARANLRGAQATLRQARLDRGAALIAALAALRNSEEQRRLLEGHIVPAAEQAAGSADRAYAAGAGDLPSLIASRRMLLDLQLTIAEVRTLREQQLAAIEELAGVDIETLADPAGDA